MPGLPIAVCLALPSYASGLGIDLKSSETMQPRTLSEATHGTTFGGRTVASCLGGKAGSGRFVADMTALGIVAAG